MRRTAARQAVRMLRFMDVFGRWEASELSQLEAAELLGVCELTFRRWCRRYEEAGESGLLDRRIGKASGKRVPVDRCAEAEALYRTRYSGFTARHFHEHLVRDHRFAFLHFFRNIFRCTLCNARPTGLCGRFHFVGNNFCVMNIATIGYTYDDIILFHY